MNRIPSNRIPSSVEEATRDEHSIQWLGGRAENKSEAKGGSSLATSSQKHVGCFECIQQFGDQMIGQLPVTEAYVTGNMILCSKHRLQESIPYTEYLAKERRRHYK